MDKKSRNILIVSIFSLLLILVGVTYAYFYASINGLESASTISLSAGQMSIDYAEGDENVTASNIYPREEAWITKTFTITGYNTTTSSMIYNVGLNVTNNTFPNYYLTYELTLLDSTGGFPIESSEGFINGDGFITFGTGSFRGSNGYTHEYELKIYFKDNGLNQNDAQEAEFNAKLSVIEGEALSYTHTIVNAPENGHTFKLSEEVEILFTIKNNGTSTISIENLVDNLTEDEWEQFILEPGQSSSIESYYMIKEEDLDTELIDEIIITTDTDTYTSQLTLPTESVHKELFVNITPTSTPSNGVAYTVNENVNFEYYIDNIGNVTLTDVIKNASIKEYNETSVIGILPISNPSHYSFRYTILPEDIGQELVFTVTATADDGTTATASYTIPVAAS